MDPVERALDELFSADPAAFTKKRDALVKDLKKAGDKDAAARVAAKRKPTQMAYVLNQLAREHPDSVAELIDVGRELAREQRRAVRGEASHGLRDSIDRQRKAISDVGAKAALVMKALGVDPMAHLQEITVALQAAMIDPIVGAALEAGQLEKAPEAAVGFGGPMPADIGSEPAPRAKKKSVPPPESEEPEEDDAEAREAEERERERAREAHARSVAEAKALVAGAASDVKKARSAASKATVEAEAAELVAEKAREAATAANKEAKRLGSEVTHAERTLAAAEKALAALEAAAP